MRFKSDKLNFIIILKIASVIINTDHNNNNDVKVYIFWIREYIKQ